MRIQRLSIERFGAFEAATLAPEGRSTVVLGANEAGKSTLLEALASLFFGFRPASLAAHPLARESAGGATPRLAALLELGGGARLEVVRGLAARAWLRAGAEGAEDSPALGNVALEGLGGVTRELYRALFALSCDELADLDGALRRHVERLLAGSADHAERPAEEVRRALAEEAAALWRPDGRGKPRAAALRAAAREARRELAEASGRERASRALLEERAALEADLARLDARQIELERARRRAELARAVAELERKLAAPRARLAERALLPGPEARLLAREDQIRASARDLGRYEAHLEELETVHGRLRALERRLAADLERLTGRAPAPAELDALAKLPLAGLRAAQRTWEAGWQASLAGRGLLPAWARAAAWAAAAVGLVAGGLVAAGVLAPAWAGLVLLPALAPLALLRARAAPPSLAGVELEPVRVMGVRDALLEAAASSPGALAELLRELAALSDRARERLVERERATDVATIVEEREEQWSALAAEAGVAVQGDGRAVLATLDAALETARRSAARAEEDAVERARARTLFESGGEDLEVLRAELARLGDPAEALDPAAALAELERERAAAHRRLGEVESALAAAPEGELARRRERLAELEDERRALLHQRDRLALLAAAVAQAERLWRERHQPPVLARAGAILERLTGGRYGELAQDPDGPPTVLARELGRRIAVAPPLSRGVRDQAALALRLALAHELDADAERLPLVLDEVLAHWDGERRRALYPLLAELAERRQIFLTTCHDGFAAEAERALDWPLLRL